MAPAGLSGSDRAALTTLVRRMAHSESWRATLTRLGWTDSYLDGPAFDTFLEAERLRVTRIVSGLRGPAGARTAAHAGEWVFPALVIGVAAVVLVALVVVARGSSAAATRDGRDTAGYDLRKDERGGFRSPVARILLGLVAFAVLLNVAGFVAAGSVLFALTASAFGSRRWVRDALIGFALCATVYVTFTHALGVPLPAGVFDAR
jgi:putative tricarboxylic transport membrane protein